MCSDQRNSSASKKVDVDKRAKAVNNELLVGVSGQCLGQSCKPPMTIDKEDERRGRMSKTL